MLTKRERDELYGQYVGECANDKYTAEELVEMADQEQADVAASAQEGPTGHKGMTMFVVRIDFTDGSHQEVQVSAAEVTKAIQDAPWVAGVLGKTIANINVRKALARI